MTDSPPDLDALRKQHGPLLDDSVVYALASDYDLTKSDEELAFIQLLEELNNGAAIHEAANDESSTADHSTTDHDSRTTPETDLSRRNIASATSEFSNLNLSTSGDSLDEDLEHLSEADKRKYLNDLFPGTGKDQINQVLSANGSLRGAIDELLNVAFISAYNHDSEDARPANQGIEAFAEELRSERGRKQKRRKNRTTDASRTNSASSLRTHTPANSNAWSNDEVNFICSRTTLRAQVVSSVYHSKGANLSRTIQELATREKTKLPTFAEADALVQAQVEALTEDFPNVSLSTIQALLHLAQNIPSATGELLEAMLARHDHVDDPVPHGKLNGVVQYTPLKIDESDHHFVPSPTSTTASSSINPYANHSHAASQAFSSASAAYRRGKSDRLMGGAAAYYAGLGHEHVRRARAETAAAADALVTSQSSHNMIDLHGVSVSDAVRIARSGTTAWWEGLGDARYIGGSSNRGSFQIVTGVGTHSRNNAPRIGPAVARSLMNEGWKVEVGRGEMYVTGKARR
ncbi:Smr domain-containing protein [Cyphellophora attinorum]|uniref:Smr domain-containing protein n=1 Tax=Cyphellophora attinorum TaxID=1664694 RepID=A0A0N0NLG7_9EURO|nr:Smr domain-containing protein [Phialophora attinorum]KPI39281.1 Smr domain-containing protein [Phialophora attinorum]